MGKAFLRSKRFWAGLLFIITWIGLYATGERTFQDILADKSFIVGVEGFILWLVSMISGLPVAFGNRTVFGRKLDN